MGMGGPILAWHRVGALQDPGSPRTLALSGKGVGEGGVFRALKGLVTCRPRPLLRFCLIHFWWQVSGGRVPDKATIQVAARSYR
jgi:hypothetical protein